MSLMLKAAKGGRTGTAVGMSRRRVMRGDPGLFGFLGRVAKGGLALATGAGVGGAARAFAGSGGSRPGIGMQQAPPLPLPRGGGSVVLPFPGPGGLQVDPMAALPGGRPLFSRVNGEGAPSGFHLNKAAYFLRDGTFVPAKSKWVKNRHRDPLNPTALRRSIARVEAGKTWQGKLSEITTAKYTAAGSRKK